MELVVFVFLAFFCLNENFLTTSSKCTGKCEQSRMNHQDTGIINRAMKGYSFKNFTVLRIYDCHVKCFEEKCRCQAFQMLQNRCELLGEDRFTAPEDFGYKAGYAYFDMNREYAKQVSCSNPCYHENRCCETNPCLHGGTCTELCDDAKHKFSCRCPLDRYGKHCQKNTNKRQKKKQRLGSCNEHFQQNGGNINSGVLQVFDSQNTSYEVYCDFESEKGFVWTLIESFTLANNNEFKPKPFNKPYPVNENSFSWERYRLSKQQMQETAGHSTHVRATCNFNTEGLDYTDYLRVKTRDLDVIQGWFRGCTTYEFIDIRGHRCQNCSYVFTSKYSHAFVEPSLAKAKGCEQSIPSLSTVNTKQYFGYYDKLDLVHRCVSHDNSTTQWWFGEKNRS